MVAKHKPDCVLKPKGLYIIKRNARPSVSFEIRVGGIPFIRVVSCEDGVNIQNVSRYTIGVRG